MNEPKPTENKRPIDSDYMLDSLIIASAFTQATMSTAIRGNADVMLVRDKNGLGYLSSVFHQFHFQHAPVESVGCVVRRLGKMERIKTIRNVSQWPMATFMHTLTQAKRAGVNDETCDGKKRWQPIANSNDYPG